MPIRTLVFRGPYWDLPVSGSLRLSMIAAVVEAPPATIINNKFFVLVPCNGFVHELSASPICLSLS